MWGRVCQYVESAYGCQGGGEAQDLPPVRDLFLTRKWRKSVVALGMPTVGELRKYQIQCCFFSVLSSPESSKATLTLWLRSTSRHSFYPNFTPKYFLQ